MITEFLLVACTLCGAEPADLGDRVEQSGLRKIVVCPRAIARADFRSKGEFVGDIGPQGDFAAQQLYDRLVNRFGKRVVPQQTAAEAMANLTANELAQPKALAEIRSQTGADALAVLLITNSSSRYYLTETLYDLRNAESVETDGQAAQQQQVAQPIHSESIVSDKGLSDAAYEGRSFEVRRWDGATLIPIGLDAGTAALSEANGWGSEFEKEHLAKLKSQSRHPLEDPALPYQFEVAVQGQVRKPERIGDRLYIQLEPGEEFAVRVGNSTGHKLFMGIWIDGVNIYGKMLEHPLNVPTYRCWVVRDGLRDGELAGWFELDKKGMSTGRIHHFAIGERSQALAVRQGAGDSLGMITCIVYTDGLQGFAHPKGPRVSKDSAVPRYGVVEGAEEKKLVTYDKGVKGIMLAAVTLYYRSGEELKELRTNSITDPTKRDPKTDPPQDDEAKPFKPGGKPDGVGTGEEKPFRAEGGGLKPETGEEKPFQAGGNSGSTSGEEKPFRPGGNPN